MPAITGMLSALFPTTLNATGEGAVALGVFSDSDFLALRALPTP